MLHAKIKIYGLVQGVTFRYSAKLMAGKFDVAGFAKNEYDGSVYIEAEGTKENLQKFINWCKKGPERARVDRLKIEYSKLLKNYPSFESKRGMDK